MDATGLVTGHILGASAITATVTHCRTFQAQLPVQVVPREYEVHGKLGDCEWDPPFCYFNSISAPLPFTVRLTWKDDGSPIKEREVYVSVYAPRAVSPARGPTNDEGIFEAAITGVPAINPYVLAFATSDVGNLIKHIEVRAVTDDFCSGIVWVNHAGPFGTRHDPGRREGTVGVAATSCTEVGYSCVTGSASVTDRCDAQAQMRTWGDLYSDFHCWWDTAVIIPKDLSMQEYNGAIDFSFTNERWMSAVSDAYGWAEDYVEIHQRGVAVEGDPENFGYCNTPNPPWTCLYEQAGQPVRCFVGKPQFGTIRFGETVLISSNLTLTLRVSAQSVPTTGGGCDLSTASISTFVSQRTTLTGVEWRDVSGVWHPLDAWIFPCSGKFTTPR